jgi:hypothetical protein
MIKKHFLVGLLLCAGLQLNAQKPVQGNYGATAGLSAIAGFLNTDASTTGSLLFKYYLQDGLALRAAVNYRSLAGAGTTFVDSTQVPVGIGLPMGDGFSTTTTTVKGSNFDLELGIQKDIAKLEKLEPYVGVAAVFGLSGRRLTDINRTWLIDGGGRTAGDFDHTETLFNTRTNVGGKVFLGANYFLLKNLCVGAEFGYGYFFTKENGGEISTHTKMGSVESTVLQNTGGYYKTTKGLRTTGAILTVSFIF